jgi:hypothetical protein
VMTATFVAGGHGVPAEVTSMRRRSARMRDVPLAVELLGVSW